MSKKLGQKKTTDTKSPAMEIAPQYHCVHGNHFCVACEECGRKDPRVEEALQAQAQKDS